MLALMLAIAAFGALLSVDTLAIVWLLGRAVSRHDEQPAAWFDHERFRRGTREPACGCGVVERVRTARGVLVHPCSYGGTPIEYPCHAGFAEDADLDTLAEIESL